MRLVEHGSIARVTVLERLLILGMHKGNLLLQVLIDATGLVEVILRGELLQRLCHSLCDHRCHERVLRLDGERGETRLAVNIAFNALLRQSDSLRHPTPRVERVECRQRFANLGRVLAADKTHEGLVPRIAILRLEVLVVGAGEARIGRHDRCGEHTANEIGGDHQFDIVVRRDGVRDSREPEVEVLRTVECQGAIDLFGLHLLGGERCFAGVIRRHAERQCPDGNERNRKKPTEEHPFLADAGTNGCPVKYLKFLHIDYLSNCS